MKGVYVDLTVDFTPDEAQGYAQIMIIVASADGALVKEELAMIEALMGRSMTVSYTHLTLPTICSV